MNLSTRPAVPAFAMEAARYGRTAPAKLVDYMTGAVLRDATDAETLRFAAIESQDGEDAVMVVDIDGERFVQVRA